MASGESSVQPFHAAIRDLGRWLDATDTLGMIIGGVAVAFLGRGRVTRDVDAVVWLDDDKLESFIAPAKRFGFHSRFSKPVAFARQAHILAMRHAPSRITVDVALASLPFEKEAIDNRLKIAVSDFEIAVPRPEDLILMKAIAQRDNDIVDIRGIVARQTKLDKRYLRRRAKEFAAMLEQPDIVKLIEEQLRPQRRR